ncbi:hypothetical protein SAMN05192558_10752 [Actinokineospora alba]|uniref:Uncharacterized protein n=1 Tax=Actinokineospora alba TaxID=504798 RepID=A0A1H0QM82_9PSEU|nr:hypothetical protein [Actinokineospora alba]TDP70486.1 hypothetical protein C8E96_6100 [Actinokineospora alba]SDI30354.1 hypothetical protein SAMN05421871_10451 [Actinokineospora alba]SDP18392.1 hypothetical protein SAMN05192558_10752 [Actinokineospora alba]
MTHPFLTPEQSLAMVKAVGDLIGKAENAIFEDIKGIKRELTRLKLDANYALVGVNGIKAEWSAIKFEPPGLDIWKMIEDRKLRARGELPEQLKATAVRAHTRITELQGKTGDLRSQVNRRISTELTGLSGRFAAIRTQIGAVDRRVSGVARDATAAVSGVRRVGTDLSTAKTALNRRIDAVRRDAAANRSGAGNDTARVQRETQLLRKALFDLDRELRGNGSAATRFRNELRAIESFLR